VRPKRRRRYRVPDELGMVEEGTAPVYVEKDEDDGRIADALAELDSRDW